MRDWSKLSVEYNRLRKGKSQLLLVKKLKRGSGSICVHAVWIHPYAEDEITEAASWYEYESLSRCADFKQSIKCAFSSIVERPQTWLAHVGISANIVHKFFIFSGISMTIMQSIASLSLIGSPVCCRGSE